MQLYNMTLARPCRAETHTDTQSSVKNTHVESYKEAIHVGVEKLGICGRLRGKLGTFGRATLGRLLVMVLWRNKQCMETIKIIYKN